MKKQKRHRQQVQKQLPKHVAKNHKTVKIDGEQVFWPAFGFGYPGIGFGAGIGVGVGLGVGLGIGGFGYYGGWL